MHASHAPHPTDYTPLILTVMTSLLTVVIWVNLITVISSRCLPYLSNLMMSWLPHGICLHSLILISQSVIGLLVSQVVFSSQFRQCPPMDCKNHRTCHATFILTLTSRKTTSITLNHLLHPCATSTALNHSLHPCHLHVFLHMLSSVAFKVSLYIFLQCILSCGYHAAYCCNNFSSFLSDGCT